MAMFYGLASVVAGGLLALKERSSFWSAARSFLALQMMLVGALLVLVGASERRAHAQYVRATQQDPDADNHSSSSETEKSA